MPGWEMEFEAPKWFLCDRELRVSNESAPLQRAPSRDWPTRGTGRTASKAQEEVLETLLILNSQALIGESIQFLFRGGDYWGVEDITGIDNLGRFHMFELKRDRVKPEVPKQLTAYLLSGLFQSGDEYLSKLWDLKSKTLTVDRWLSYLTAAQANERTSNLGRGYVNQHHPQITAGELERFTKTSWANAFERKTSDTRRSEALISVAQRKCAEVPSLATHRRMAQEIVHEFSANRPIRPVVRPKRQAVIWLVGRGFSRSVFEDVRMWRRAGIDARCLDLDARQSKRTGLWSIRVKREKFPHRTLLLSKLAIQQESIESIPAANHLRIHLYTKGRPSDTNLEQGGLPLGSNAHVVVNDQHSKPIMTVTLK